MPGPEKPGDAAGTPVFVASNCHVPGRGAVSLVGVVMELPESAPSNKLKTWLFNPFHYIAGGVALGVGLVVILLGEVLSKVSIGALLAAI